MLGFTAIQWVSRQERRVEHPLLRAKLRLTKYPLLVNTTWITITNRSVQFYDTKELLCVGIVDTCGFHIQNLKGKHAPRGRVEVDYGWPAGHVKVDFGLVCVLAFFFHQENQKHNYSKIPKLVKWHVDFNTFLVTSRKTESDVVKAQVQATFLVPKPYSVTG